MQGRLMSRDKAIEQYLISRMKLEEWLLLFNLVKAANEGRIHDPGYVLFPGVDFGPALFRLAIAWFSTLVDKHKDAINVFDVWSELFRAENQEITEVKALFDGQLARIRALRDKVVFHGEKSIVNYFRALIEFDKHKDEVAEPLARFGKLAEKLVRSEQSEIPDLREKAEMFLVKLRAEFPRDYGEYQDSIQTLLGLT